MKTFHSWIQSAALTLSLFASLPALGDERLISSYLDFHDQATGEMGLIVTDIEMDGIELVLETDHRTLRIPVRMHIEGVGVRLEGSTELNHQATVYGITDPLNGGSVAGIFGRAYGGYSVGLGLMVLGGRARLVRSTRGIEIGDLAYLGLSTHSMDLDLSLIRITIEPADAAEFDRLYGDLHLRPFTDR